MKTKTYITSDSHFYHKTTLKWDMRKRFNSQIDIEPENYDKNILYEDTLKMNEELISNWNSVVGENDLVYHLGDISFASATRTREVLERLNGKIFLIKGNHDKWKELKKLSDLFVDIKDYHEIKYQFENKNYHICMMHYPIASWNRKHYNSMMLHGHCHGNDHRGIIDNEIKNGNIIYDVGVDTELANFKPILLDDIIIKTREKISNF